MRRLANKEQEFQDYVSQIAEYKAAQAPGISAIRSSLLDPAVNLLFEKLKKELQATKAKLEETQNELAAWKFTPDSNTGKRLMAKCRLLYQENEELGKMTSNGRLAKLETELAMQKSFSDEVKKSQSELDDFLQELDEDVEGMQSTILFLQQELKTTRDRIQLLEKENYLLKNETVDDEDSRLMVCSSHSLINGKKNPVEAVDNDNSSASKCVSSITNQTTNAAPHYLTDEQSNNKYLSNHSYQLSTVAVSLNPIDDKISPRMSAVNCAPGSAGDNSSLSEFVNGGGKDTVIGGDDQINKGACADIASGCCGEGNKLRVSNSRKRHYESDSSDSGSASITTKISRSTGANVTSKRGKKKQPIDRLSSVPHTIETKDEGASHSETDGSARDVGTVVVTNSQQCNEINIEDEDFTSSNQVVATLTEANSRTLARKKSLRNSLQNGESNN